MEGLKRLHRKGGLFLLLLLVAIIAGSLALKGAEQRKRKELNTVISTEAKAAEQLKKGYDLPVDAQERKEAEEQCKKVMEHISGIYEQADKGESSNVILSDETVLEMQHKVRELGYPVVASVTYSNMENQEGVEKFLEKCMEGKQGSIVLYQVYCDGSIGRRKFIFDGTDLYVVSASGIWNSDNQPRITDFSHTRIKAWNYTDKGWFCYELCVPEPPEVTEIVDGSFQYLGNEILDDGMKNIPEYQYRVRAN